MVCASAHHHGRQTQIFGLKRQDRFDDDGYWHPLSAEPEAMSADDVSLAEAMQYKRTMTPAMPWSLVRCQSDVSAIGRQ